MSKLNRFFPVRRAAGSASLIGLGLVCLVGGPLIGGSLSGCGGSSARRRDETGNRLVIPLDWPARTRALPQAANSVRVDIVQGDTVIARKVAQRPSGDSANTVNLLFNDVPNGAITVRITAHPDNDATIIELAQASFPVTVTARTTTLPPVTLQSTLTALTIVPDIKQLNLGQGQEVVATPRNAQGGYVLALASNYTWTTTNPTVVRVDTNPATGDRAVLRAQALGQSTITVTERESGLSFQTVVTVSPQSETPADSRYRFTVIADSTSEVEFFSDAVIDDRGNCWFVGSIRGGGKAVYTGSNGTLSRFADTLTGQFTDLEAVGDVSRSGGSVVFTGVRAGSKGVFLLQNNIITQITNEANDIRNLSADTLVNDAGTIAYIAQGDVGFSDANTRNIYRWKGGASERIYSSPTATAVPDLLDIEADDSIYFRSNEGDGSVSRVAGLNQVTQVALPFDKNASAFSVIAQGTNVSAFGTQITAARDYARRNRAGQIVFVASGTDGRTRLLRADPLP